jgi:prolyl oligopeptidase
MPQLITDQFATEEVLHGVRVRDPYRWLEERSLPETEAWIREQSHRCRAYFAGGAEYNAIRAEVSRHLDVATLDQPVRVGDRYFYRRRDEGEEQAKIYLRDSTTTEERVLIEPSHGDPTSSIRIHRVSQDGSWMAYESQRGGGDRKRIHFLHVDSAMNSAVFLPEGNLRGLAFGTHAPGIFYCLDDLEGSNDHTITWSSLEGSSEEKVCLRVRRTPGSRLILTSDATRLGAIHVHRRGNVGLIDFRVAKQHKPTEWRSVFADRPAPYAPILHCGRLFALSFADAPNGRCVELDWNGNEICTVITEQETRIRASVVGGNSLFVDCFSQMTQRIQQWSLDGTDVGELKIPIDGTARLLVPLGPCVDSIFYTWESFAQPPILFEYEIYKRIASPRHIRPSAATATYTVQHASYPALDDTPIPITVVVPSRATSAVSAPALMTSYGGFGVPMTPQFSVFVTIMLQLGVNFAMPHIRGGGDFGKGWHDAGRRRNRQTAIDDFLAAGDWLCRSGITSPQNLAIFGGSNAGLLVGAAMTQRPELFRAVICIAPLLDMVRYERFDGAGRWREEYGSIDDSDDFHVLCGYSPYHRVEDAVDYPATLFVSGDRDDRCNPAHVRKMVALLQNREAQQSPILMDYSEERGHRPTLPLNLRIDALSRRIQFLCRELRIPVSFEGAP